MSKDYTEEEYPILINKLMQHIAYIKEHDTEVSILDIIYDYSFKKELPVELVGDAISTDAYFKSFVEADYKMRLSLPSDNKIDEW
jgi:hypothetical protein